MMCWVLGVGSKFKVQDARKRIKRMKRGAEQTMKGDPMKTTKMAQIQSERRVARTKRLNQMKIMKAFRILIAIQLWKCSSAVHIDPIIKHRASNRTRVELDSRSR
jgi:hypothetical protein